jgi:hypothetical protein
MSHVKTDKLSARTPSGTITLGESGEKLSFVAPLDETNHIVKTGANNTNSQAIISAYRAGDGVVSGNRAVIRSIGDGAGNATVLRFDTNSTERLRIDSDGIKFNGDSAAANALNDYEEGTWTAVIADAASSGNESSTSADTAIYTKIGNIVTVSCQFSNIDITGLTTSNRLHLTGFPFECSSRGAYAVWAQGMTLGGVGNPVARMNPGYTYTIFDVLSDGGNDSTIAVSSISGGGADISICITYTTNS